MKTFCLLLLTSALLTGASTSSVSPAPVEPASMSKLPRSGPDVLGYFEGRSPCQEIVDLLGASGREECIKIKWQLILYRDPKTQEPTTYALGGFAWRNPPKTGKWAISKGIVGDPGATVYQLDPDDPKKVFSFLKGDDNILFFLDKKRNLMVGNSRFSYTLNRK